MFVITLVVCTAGASEPVPYIAMVKGVRGPREKSSRNR